MNCLILLFTSCCLNLTHPSNSPISPQIQALNILLEAFLPFHEVLQSGVKSEEVTLKCSVKNVLLKTLQNLQKTIMLESLFQSIAGLQIPKQAFSSESREIFQKTFFPEHFWETASESDVK